MKRLALLLCLALPCQPPARSGEARLSPRLHAGQSLVYRIDFSSSRETKTESRVLAPQVPPGARLSASAVLQVRVVQVGADGARLETYLSEKPREATQVPGEPGGSADSAPDKRVDLLLGPDGRASQVKGLEQLSAAQQFAWSDWLGRFASSMTYPKAVRQGQRWEAAEPEAAPAPIAGLKWIKKYQYVHDEPCRAADAAGQRPATPESCAVIFVQAILRQTSSPKNTTPPEFKLQNLTTRGTASGQNQTVLYISKATGLLIRSTEDAQQAMNVVVALTDGSNQVHYDMTAKSRSQVELLPDEIR